MECTAKLCFFGSTWWFRCGLSFYSLMNWRAWSCFFTSIFILQAQNYKKKWIMSVEIQIPIIGIATADTSRCDRSQHSVRFYTVDIFPDLDNVRNLKRKYPLNLSMENHRQIQIQPLVPEYHMSLTNHWSSSRHAGKNSTMKRKKNGKEKREKERRLKKKRDNPSRG